MDMESERVELQKSLVDEITKGMEQVKQLKVSSSTNILQERMLASYEEALLILTGRAPQGHCQSSSSLKRKYEEEDTQTFTIQGSGPSFDQVPDDGNSWRKYWQKGVFGAKFSRSYYRCPFAYGQGCVARKQVQRSDDDPTKFVVKLRGKHTCQAGDPREHT